MFSLHILTSSDLPHELTTEECYLPKSETFSGPQTIKVMNYNEHRKCLDNKLLLCTTADYIEMTW